MILKQDKIIIQSIQCAISVVELREDGILEITIEGNKDFEMDDVEELMDAADSLGNGKKLLNLIVVGDGTLPNREAREFAASEEGSKYKLADAFVVKSLAQKIIGNFMKKFSYITVPTEIFTEREEAVKWLKSL